MTALPQLQIKFTAGIKSIVLIGDIPSVMYQSAKNELKTNEVTLSDMRIAPNHKLN